MKKYELLVVLPGTLDEKESAARIEEVLAMLKENSQDAELHELGKNRLAYPIKQIRYGYYYTIVFDAEPVGLKVIQEKLALMRDLLRTMITFFNTNITTAQKIAYSTNELGITTMAERAGDKPVVKDEKSVAPVDLAEIDKKLDEIIDGGIIPGI